MAFLQTNNQSSINRPSIDREQYESWHVEVESILNREHFHLNRQEEQTSIPRLMDPNDDASMMKIRDHVNHRSKKRKEHLLTVNTNAELITSKLMQRLCVTDLDRKRIAKLTSEVMEIKATNLSLCLQNEKRKDELAVIKERLREYELEERRVEAEKRLKLSQRTDNYEQQRQTLKRVAEIFEAPKPSSSSKATAHAHVDALRRQFAKSDERINSTRPLKMQPLLNVNMKELKNKPFMQQVSILAKAAVPPPASANTNGNNDGGGAKASSTSSGSSAASSSTYRQRRSKSIGTFYQYSPYRPANFFHKVADHH